MQRWCFTVVKNRSKGGLEHERKENQKHINKDNSASAEETTASMEELNAIIIKSTERAKEVDEKANDLKLYVNAFKV